METSFHVVVLIGPAQILPKNQGMSGFGVGVKSRRIVGFGVGVGVWSSGPGQASGLTPTLSFLIIFENFGHKTATKM